MHIDLLSTIQHHFLDLCHTFCTPPTFYIISPSQWTTPFRTARLYTPIFCKYPRPTHRAIALHKINLETFRITHVHFAGIDFRDRKLIWNVNLEFRSYG